MQETLEIILKRLADLEKKVENYYNLLKLNNELDFILKGNYVLNSDIEKILNGN